MKRLNSKRLRSARRRGSSAVSLVLAFSVLVFLAVSGPDPDGFREWNDLHDRRFEAKLVGVSEESVMLANRAGKKIEFPIEDLSSADKKYSSLWSKAGDGPKPTEPPSEFRKWNDLQGRSYEAKLIDIGERMVKLQDKAGRQTSLPIAEFSVADKDHIHEWDAYGRLEREKKPIPSRRWTNSQGRYFEAQLVDAASHTVKFQNDKGKQIVYIIADLSREDRFFLERLSRDEGPEIPGGPTSPAGVVPDLDDVESINRKLVALRAGGPKFTAVLINGDTSTLHKSNLLTAHETLRKLGHRDNDIVVLSSNFAPSSKFLREIGSITAAASPENVRAVFGGLQEVCTSDDTVFVYTTGHGNGNTQGNAYLVLENKRGYSAGEFGKFVGGLDGKFISVMDQCFSGGMVEAIPASRPNTIAISAAPPDQKTFCKYFAESFWASIQDLSCDGDGDGVVSITEAFEISIKEHKRRVTWVSTDGMLHAQPRDVVLMPRPR